MIQNSQSKRGKLLKNETVEIDQDSLVNCLGQTVKVGQEIVYVPVHSWGDIRVGRIKRVFKNRTTRQWEDGTIEAYDGYLNVLVQGVTGGYDFIYDDPTHAKSEEYPYGNYDGKTVAGKFMTYGRYVGGKSFFPLEMFDVSQIPEEDFEKIGRWSRPELSRRKVDFLKSLPPIAFKQ